MFISPIKKNDSAGTSVAPSCPAKLNITWFAVTKIITSMNCIANTIPIRLNIICPQFFSGGIKYKKIPIGNIITLSNKNK